MADPEGDETYCNYDDANRLTRISNVRSDGSLIPGFRYQHDANGRRTVMRETDEEGNNYYTNYEYDSEGRFTSVIYLDGIATEFTYDRRSNIIERTYYVNKEVIGEVESEYDEGNRLLSMGDSDSNETGQYYYRARMYSPVQSRFLSNDPMGMVDGPNMYMYVRNDPINLRDPTGRWNVFWGPPMLINGGAGVSGECGGNFATFADCYYSFIDAGYDSSTAQEECAQICASAVDYGSGTGNGGGNGLPSPPAGAECGIDYIRIFGVIIGYEFWCNKKASTYIAEWCALAGGLSLVLSKFFPPLISISIACGAFSFHAAFCSLFFDAGVRYTQIGNAPPVPRCYSE